MFPYESEQFQPFSLLDGEIEKALDLTVPLSCGGLCDERGEMKGCVEAQVTHP
jgi:hypothetical protein